MADEWDQFPDYQAPSKDPWDEFPDYNPAPTAKTAPRAEEAPSSLTDVAKTIPSGLARGVSGALGLPGEIGHGMRYLTDQARQAFGYPASPGYVSGETNPYNPLDVNTQDVQKRIEQVTGPLYEPKTTAGRYANTAAEIAGGTVIPFGGASSNVTRAAGEIIPYARNWAASSIGAGTAGEAAADVATDANLPPVVQAGARLAGTLAGGIAAPSAMNTAFFKGPPDPRMIEKTLATEAAQQEGISVPKAAVASSLMKPLAGRIASLPIAGEPLQNAARTSLDEMGKRVQKIAEDYGSGNYGYHQYDELCFRNY